MRQAKVKALKYYKRWRSQKTYCPALKENIRVSLRGWCHITGATGHKKRVVGDVYRRLKLLPHAKAIIKKSSTIQDIIKKNGNIYFVLEAVKPVKEKGITQFRKVRVVLVEDKKTKEKVFLSVMDKKKRPRRKRKKQKTPKT